jgi:YggT family protein
MIFANPLCFLLGIYLYVLWARIIISLVLLFKPTWAPPSGIRPVLDLVYALTDPPISALRRVVPQPFGFPIDLAFLIWFLIIVVARGVVCGTGGVI